MENADFTVTVEIDNIQYDVSSAVITECNLNGAIHLEPRCLIDSVRSLSSTNHVDASKCIK